MFVEKAKQENKGLHWEENSVARYHYSILEADEIVKDFFHRHILSNNYTKN